MKIVEEKQVFGTIMNTVNKLVDLVKPTFGHQSNKVIIGKGFYVSALDDGVQIAKDLELEDEAENYVLKMIREVAVRTNDRVGDGTTSSLIILQALMKEIEKGGKVDGRKITEELKQGLLEAVSQLKKQARKIKSKEDLEKVARISFDNADIAKLLAEIVHKIGADGLIDVETSQGFDIESEMMGGFKMIGGYVSPYMITEKEEALLEDPYILVANMEFVNENELLPIIQKILDVGRNSLVIFCKGIEGGALNLLVINKLQGKFKSLAVKTVSNNDFEDIALLTGATLFSPEKGKPVMEIKDLGRAKKVISKRDTTVIMGGKSDKKVFDTRVKELKDKIENAKDNTTREQTKYKLARLTNSVAVIKVGADTENEAKALRYKVEDASNAVKVAFKDGVVKGAGIALAQLKTSSPLLNKALRYPNLQLEENTGGIEYNDSIIDPVAVLIAGLESAVSIACLLSSVKGIIVEEKPKTI
jgi:chaperonin GroEL